MLGFFRRQPQQVYVIIARYGSGNWMKRFEIAAASPYEACRKFDQTPEFHSFTRVSGATISTGF
jgi:hypothetical protein